MSILVLPEVVAAAIALCTDMLAGVNGLVRTGDLHQAHLNLILREVTRMMASEQPARSIQQKKRALKGSV